MTTHRPARFALSSLLLTAAAALAFAGACADDADVEDGELDSAAGKADSMAEGSAEALAVLRLVNDPAVTKAELDDDGGLSARVAGNIVNARNGADRVAGTGDDNPFDTLAELDAIPYVGPRTLEMLLEYARSKGLLDDGLKIDVVFSPQPAGQTHAARIAAMIRAATTSVDVAMYSFSDAEIATALTEAVARGVKVRFLFETARTDKNISDLAARTASKSGKLEKTNVDVRWVNKILHHKFVIVDGPRDDAGKAATAKIATGSANWSFGGSSIYDENTLFVEGYQEVAQAYQREFDLLWKGSGDFALAQPIERVYSTTAFPTLTDDGGVRALFTSANFTPPTGASTTFRVDKSKTLVADEWVKAINAATTSIQIAHGHARLRPVALALIAKKQANPNINIQVLLDQQEFISVTTDNAQRAELEDCLEEAGADVTAQRECTENDFLYGRMIGLAGIDVRYKSYAYRWDATYAVQMHNKYMIVDGDELFTGSYNWSMNAEHGTFENVLVCSTCTASRRGRARPRGEPSPPTSASAASTSTASTCAGRRWRSCA
jgi:phosphatidylserine/phosphatidylglycerophosphate/cardiolipin synthase-like enzyme